MFDTEDFLNIEDQDGSLFENISKKPRLKGGSSFKEAEDLLDVSDVSDDFVPTKGVTPKPLLPETIPEQEKLSKLALTIKYTKMIVIVLILVIAIVLLARVKEFKSMYQLIVLEPNRLKTIKIEDFDEKQKEVEILLTGPFSMENECENEGGKVMPSINLYFTQTENGQQIGDSWKVCSVDPSEFDTAEEMDKEKIFHLADSNEGRTIFMNFLAVNINENLCIKVYINTTPIDRSKSVIYGAVVLFFLYFMIVTEIVDRTFASLIAAALSLGFLALCNSKVNQDTIITWIDVETLALLVGMMLLVSILAESGIFDYFAVFAYKVAKGRVWALINCLSFFTAFLAMFLDSVTMMLLATPVTIRLCEVLALDPVPVLICMVLFANVGAASTPVGDPPNVIITLNPAVAAINIDFGNFFLHMFPGVALALAQTYLHIRILYRKPQSLRFKNSKQLEDLRLEISVWERTAAGISPGTQDEDVARDVIREKIRKLKEKLEEEEKTGGTKEPPSFKETLEQLTMQYPLRDKPLLIKASLTFFFVLILFCTHSIPGLMHISLGWSALIGAILLIIISDRRDLEAILVRIEWTTLLFFAALFIVMESLSLLGVIDLIGTFAVKIISSVKPEFQMTLAIVIVTWVSSLASAFLDNIPVTTMMLKIISILSKDSAVKLPLRPLVWSLAFGACFGGNGTLIGASANLVTAGVAEQHGYKISFLKFFYVCFPVMLGNAFVATIYLLICHAIGWQ